MKRFHDNSPVLLAAVEFVMETFDWRPPKFYFRIWKNVFEWHMLLITAVIRKSCTEKNFYFSSPGDHYRCLFGKYAGWAQSVCKWFVVLAVLPWDLFKRKTFFRKCRETTVLLYRVYIVTCCVHDSMVLFLHLKIVFLLFLQVLFASDLKRFQRESEPKLKRGTGKVRVKFNNQAFVRILWV